MRRTAIVALAVLWWVSLGMGQGRADDGATGSTQATAQPDGSGGATPVAATTDGEGAGPAAATTDGEGAGPAVAAPAPTIETEVAEEPPLRVSGELKQRGEARRNNDFGTGTADEPRFVGQLIRLKFVGKVSEIRYTVELSDGRNFGTERKTGSVQATSLVQGYLELGDRTKLRLGRQEITLGKKRLIGSSGWGYQNLAAYDGARLQTEIGPNALDLFAVKVAGGATAGKDDTTLAALSYTWKGSKVWKPGLYVLFHHEDALEGWSGTTDMPIFGTIGSIGVTSAVKLDYEAIFERGTRRGLKQRASLYHGGIKYAPPKARYWLGVEYNLASGDSNPGDGVSRTFDKLYSINHSKYGFIDYQDPRNMKNLRFTVGVKATKKIATQVDYHIFRLDRAQDAWYSRQAGVSLKDPTGAAGTDVGSELDFTAKGEVHPRLAVEVGYCRFFSGSFVKTVLGGPVPQPDFGYVQLRVRF